MDFQRESILKKILNNKDIVNLINEYNISNEIIERDLLSLYSYLVLSEKCLGCIGLKECTQNINGHIPRLSYGNCFKIDYIECPYMQNLVSRVSIDTNLITIACNIDNIDYDSIFVNQARKQVLTKMYSIYTKYIGKQQTKGLYLHGIYGAGKSYIMSYYAKQFANDGYKVVFAYFPDLVRMLKSSIKDGSLEDIVDDLKKVDVLFFDDFGGEFGSSFIRDEVVGAILQYRMVNGLLTFITSNLDFKSLHEHLAENKQEIDDVKASRVIERIKALMDVIELSDKNYRNM